MLEVGSNFDQGIVLKDSSGEPDDLDDLKDELRI